MPLFEYVCEDCRNEFEALVRSAQEQVSCPKCRGTHLAKRFSAPASAQVRGGSGSAPAPLPTMGCGGPACQQGFCGGG